MRALLGLRCSADKREYLRASTAQDGSLEGVRQARTLDYGQGSGQVNPLRHCWTALARIMDES